MTKQLSWLPILLSLAMLLAISAARAQTEFVMCTVEGHVTRQRSDGTRIRYPRVRLMPQFLLRLPAVRISADDAFAARACGAP
jgi:hypothetical protein